MNKKPNLFNQVIISSIEDYKNKIETLTKQKERLIRRDKKHREEIERLNNNWELLKEYIKRLPSNEYIGYWKYNILEDIDKIKENSNA